MRTKFFAVLNIVVLLLIARVSNILRAELRPNILVIVADDLGYADLGFQGCRDIKTPHLDELAQRSIRCSSGYVSHPFCSPTRAGLMTGRYQQKFGHENNPTWLPEDTVAGLPVSVATLPQLLQPANYRTIAIGKWHLGAHRQFHPNARGFLHYFGLLGGGHNYFPAEIGSAEYNIPMDRNGQPEPLDGYLTDVLVREARRAIAGKSDQPWFMYLAFNAPHSPLHVTSALAKRAEHIADETRRGYAGLVMSVDDGVGAVMAELRNSNQLDNTLVFFISDNGGPVNVTHANNGPLRGAKGQVYEGGIRVPFLVSWPSKLAKGVEYKQPVISLDIFATCLAAAQTPALDHGKMDGRNLLPYLMGEQSGAPHDKLFWRTGGGVSWAVRSQNWKLLKVDQKEELYNLATDLGETRDLATQETELVNQLNAAYAQWNKSNVEPLFQSPGGGRARKNPGPAKVTIQD